MPGLFMLAIALMVIAVLAGVGVLVAGAIVRREQATRKAWDKEKEERGESPASDLYHVPVYQSTSGTEVSARSARYWLRIVALVAVVLALVFTFWSSATIVSTKNVGIVTSFGKPTGSLSNGFHLVAPWAKVTELDAAIQTDSHYEGDKPGCIQVRIVRQAQACADVSIRWRIRDNASDQLFKDYRGFDNIRDSLVTRELNSKMNAEFDQYDPLGLDAHGQSTAPSSQELSAKVTADMRKVIGNQIDVLNVIIGVVHFDKNTQSRVDALQAQVAQTRIQEQAIITAQKQADANRALSKSLNNDPNVLTSKCLDLLGEMISKGQQIPINGLPCWPGSNSTVVVPATSGNTTPPAATTKNGK